MSISDTLMWRYYLLLTDLHDADIAELRSGVEAGSLHPKEVKIDLARRVVRDFHGAAAAAAAATEFDRVHTRGDLPSELRMVALPFGAEQTLALTHVLVNAGLAASASDAGRKIRQGGVRLNGDRISDLHMRLSRAELPAVLQVGRQAVRLLDA
jgi:tyrosyl-tRNA synthetase